MIQLSDCHLPGSRTTPYRGVDAYEHLGRVLERVQEWAPELVLATGDLSEDASGLAYQWLADRLAVLGVPVLTLPGNHDEPERLRHVFSRTVVDEPLVHDAGVWRLVLLNSVIPGQVPGRLHAVVLEALEQVLADSGRPVLVALHHQPVAVGSPWIDRYPLLEPDSFWAVIRRNRCVRAVCWGHVHQPLDQLREGVRLLACPSTATNSLVGCERFTPDPAGPACRWLVLEADGSLETGLLFGGEGRREKIEGRRQI